MVATADVLVVGAGIAGASAAFALARAGFSVRLLEREDQPGYHSTGRSAALFVKSYGNATVRELTRRSEAFFREPPEDFAETPLLHPRGVLLIARSDQLAALEREYAFARRFVPTVRRLDGEAARRMVPLLREGYAVAAVLDPEAADIDVHALLQGYLRGLRRYGGELVLDAGVGAIVRQGSCWRLHTRAGIHEAPLVINAAGAWADRLAEQAGIPPLGLVPMRRTAFILDPPAGIAVDRWPAVIDVEERFYVKPDAGRLLGSPADETPSPPCDAAPEEIDIAVAVERILAAFALEVRTIRRRWAGLRTFAPDRTPVLGFAPEAEGFFWLAGQGGYGIQTAPAMAELTRRLVAGEDADPLLAALRPGRLRNPA